jgi:hypothetical protein
MPSIAARSPTDCRQPSTGATASGRLDPQSRISTSLTDVTPRSPSLPVHIFSQIQWQGDPTIVAASSLQIVIIGMLILVAQRIFRLLFVV